MSMHNIQIIYVVSGDKRSKRSAEQIYQAVSKCLNIIGQTLKI